VKVGHVFRFAIQSNSFEQANQCIGGVGQSARVYILTTGKGGFLLLNEGFKVNDSLGQAPLLIAQAVQPAHIGCKGLIPLLHHLGKPGASVQLIEPVGCICLRNVGLLGHNRVYLNRLWYV